MLLYVYKDHYTAAKCKRFFSIERYSSIKITTYTQLQPRFLLQIPIMKSTLCMIVAAILMACFTIATPIAEPAPDAVADAFQFYGASQTAQPIKRDNGKRELRVRRDDVIPEALLTRSNLVRRTQSPVSGGDANKCSPVHAVGGISYTCGTGNDGPCCSINVSLRVSRWLFKVTSSLTEFQGWCGANSYYCGGGCQGSYGSCVLPIIGLTYDADAGDSIWDVSTDNVFDAQVGDGIIYYGSGMTPSKCYLYQYRLI